MITEPKKPSPTLLRVSQLSKSYASKVLSNVAFDLRAGEVHALVGENGAGKSTLARIISGLVKADDGEMFLLDAPFAPARKTEAEKAGVRMVLQELNLIGNLTIAENIFFDQIPHRFGWVDYPRLNQRAKVVMAKVGLEDLDPAEKATALGVGQQQLIEIAASLSRHCRILILDEPTAALTDPEIEKLFVQIRKLRADGVGIIYISHRLEEIKAIADRITVLRDGTVVTTREVGELTTEEIVRLMVGRELGDALPRTGRSRGSLALKVRDLNNGATVRGVSFELHRGEILGMAGLMGSGRTETVRAIFGADSSEDGHVYIGESQVPSKIRSPRDAVRQGIALLSEDRKGQGLFLPLSVRFNISLPNLSKLSSRGGWMSAREEELQATHWQQALNIRCASTGQPVVRLSGGNQQKVVIAKWLLRDCAVFIFDEPTRGIDVGAKFEIYQLLANLSNRGKGILVVSSDLQELTAVCDRIIVMSAGRIAASLNRDEWNEEKIMAAALSGYIGEGIHRS